MSVIRQKRRSKYTVVDNASINDERLSLRAKGLHVVLLSKPDHWEFSSERLAAECLEGRDAVRAALRELKEAGYVVEVREQSSEGFWSTYTEVYEVPADEVPVSPGGRPGVAVRGTDRLRIRRSVNRELGEPEFGEPGDKSKHSVASTESKSLRSNIAPRRGASGKTSRPARSMRPQVDDGEELEATGRAPGDDPVKPEPTDLREFQSKRKATPTSLAHTFAKKALAASVPAAAKDTIINAAQHKIAKWVDQGHTLDDVRAAMDLFFINPDSYLRPGKTLWFSFHDAFPGLMAKVTAPDITNPDYYSAHQEDTVYDPDAYMQAMKRKYGIAE